MQIEKAFEHITGDSKWTPAQLLGYRRQAFQQATLLGLPKRGLEDWKYTSTRSISASYAWLASEQASERQLHESFFADGAQTLVFLNGRFSESHSRLRAESGVFVQTLDMALAHQDAELFQLFDCYRAGVSTDYFEELNKAFASSGAIVKISANTKLQQPLQLLYIYTEGQEPQIIAPRTFVQIGAGAEAHLIESHFSFLEHNLVDSVVDLVLAQNAKCHYVAERVLSSASLHISKTRFHLAEESRLDAFSLALGGKINRNHIICKFAGEESFARLDGLYIGRGSTHIDNLTELQHDVPRTKSSQIYKGILFDQSRAVFNGKIDIARDAQQTSAQQLSRTLLMSSEAEIDTKPQLKIDADDVKCSHGATVGQVDSQEIFYLQSRGISRADAEVMLSKAFIKDLIDRNEKPATQSRLYTLLNEFAGLEQGLVPQTVQ